MNKNNNDNVKLINMFKYEDNRGVYIKNYNISQFLEKEFDFKIVESSDIYNKKGALRGLHYQTSNPQAKLIRLISGKIFDVAIDLRKDSSNYGQVYEYYLDNNNFAIYIPKGFAHGFLALEENTIISYHSDNLYDSNSENGICWNSNKYKINWPLKKYGIKEIIISEKDKSWSD